MKLKGVVRGKYVKVKASEATSPFLAKLSSTNVSVEASKKYDFLRID